MKKLIVILLISLSFLIIPRISSHAEGEEITVLSGTKQIITETEEEPFLTGNQISLLVVALIIYILAIFLSVLINNKLLLAFSGLLWVIPIIIIDNYILRVFSAIVIVVSFLILTNNKEEYYE